MYSGAGLLADREKEEWWEHYIAVKLDLVENILGDDTAFVEEPSSSVRAAPSAADDMTTPRLGTLPSCWPFLHSPWVAKSLQRMYADEYPCC